MHIVIISIIWVLVSVFFAQPVAAAKKFVPKAGVKSAAPARGGGGSVPVSVKYRADKRAINFNFTNFSGLSSVSYIFQYDSNNGTQGAAGTISSGNSPAQSRELLFGTCSTSVCTYHSGLKNAKLTFTANYTNGKKTSKIFRIKTYF